jgi:sugar transferase (PEP-CTERM system associated)
MIRLFKVFIPASIIGLVFSEFLLIYFCYTVAACGVGWLVYGQFNPITSLGTDYQYWKIAVVVVSIMAGIYFQDLYSKIHVHSGVLLFQQACTAIGIAIAIQGVLTYALQGEWSTGRWVMLVGTVLTLLLVPPWRMFYGVVVLKAVGTQRTLFLGTSYAIQEIAKHIIEQPEVGMQNLGYIDNHEDVCQPPPGGKILGTVSELTTLADQLKPDVIVVGLEEPRDHMPVDQMLQLRFSGIRFEEAPVTFETTFGRVLTRHLHPSQLIFSTDMGQRRRNPFWHEVYSMLFTLILIVIFIPVMLLVAILVRISSAGPVLLRQKRVGRNDATFALYKFRSMYANAEAKTGAVWASAGDPRVTPIGKWLRRLRLDELPQLFNVLRGEMLLVGPRPERPEFVNQFKDQIAFYRYRHTVKPGITGWAQINYKYGATLEDTIIKLEYDLYYIKHRSISLDILIILRTLKVMLFSGLAR